MTKQEKLLRKAVRTTIKIYQKHKCVNDEHCPCLDVIERDVFKALSV